jgi:hypothetical protein
MHVDAKTAIKAAVQLEIKGTEYILVSLRLPFGGSPYPSDFFLISDVITDTTNDLMANDNWNPEEVFSQYVHKIPSPKKLPDNIPFAQAKQLSVKIDDGDKCKADVFIDDVITVGVDVKDNLKRIIAGPCTIMHAIAHKDDPISSPFIPRQDFIADDKNEAEGAPEEVKVTLGWELNSRSLLVKLPFHKFKAWTSQVDSFISRKSSNSKDLQSVLGRLENVAIIIPMFGHFLNNIRQLQIKAELINKNVKINQRAKDDFTLAKQFLERAHNGVNMNLITFRRPDKIYINDASEHGLGGFVTYGRAWSWVIPVELRGRAHINLLEFLAQLISIWINFIEKRLNPLDFILGMGDNTASMGWLRRSNFWENDEQDQEWLAKQKVARKVAEVVLESQTTLYRQWFRGADNTVADSLSRDAYFLPRSSHKKFLQKTSPSQVPKNFKICLVPKKICSFVTSILQLLPVKQQRLIPQKPSKLALSNAGLLSCLALDLKESISTGCQSFSRTSLCQPSPSQCKKQLSLVQIKTIWWKEQSTPPSHMWHRPFGQTTGQIQDWTLTVRCASSCKNSSEHIAIKMGLKESRKLYQ